MDNEPIEGHHYWKEYSEPDMVVSSQELWEHLKDQKVRGFRIPQFPELDNLVGGFQEGELVVVSGLTSHGKTCFCQSLTKAIIENGEHALWFSFEVTTRQFLGFMEENGEVPLFYMPQQLKAKDLSWIENRIKESIIKYNIKAVFIDHLHYLLDYRLRNTSLEIGEMMRFLKEISIKYSIVIFLIAHSQKIDSEAEPSISTIRDSSFVGQEADTVIIILRLKEDNRANLKVDKARRVGTFGKKIKLIKKKYFEEEVDEGKVEHEDKWWNNKNINLPYRNGGDEE